MLNSFKGTRWERWWSCLCTDLCHLFQTHDEERDACPKRFDSISHLYSQQITLVTISPPLTIHKSVWIQNCTSAPQVPSSLLPFYSSENTESLLLFLTDFLYFYRFCSTRSLPPTNLIINNACSFVRSRLFWPLTHHRRPLTFTPFKVNSIANDSWTHDNTNFSLLACLFALFFAGADHRRSFLHVKSACALLV